MTKTLTPKEIQQKKIVEACRGKFLSLGDLVEITGMNKHTLRAHYLYPLVESGKLIREPGPPAKSTVKYKAAKRA